MNQATEDIARFIGQIAVVLVTNSIPYKIFFKVCDGTIIFLKHMN